MINGPSDFRPHHHEIPHSLSADEHGATATEYSILAGFIAIAIVAGVGLFGTSLSTYVTGLATGIKTALGIP
jgi:pilus assembly protein Flp/PilA